ncbi:uncharacterized protein RCC_09220 [Ramularia collo-cygni]|uniref:Uncharacterized protein n=1 Tax=Ramularia collo-cygni TaxID=112498 RepID=A0A2D3V2A5_9PEZI|nr:uncharacterized protein RCC_09220 [Ramularia collo-cygni]CZT23506.1 uncharacterized protein RCC_09220 [Ramularia collo-cygni]
MAFNHPQVMSYMQVFSAKHGLENSANGFVFYSDDEQAPTFLFPQRMEPRPMCRDIYHLGEGQKTHFILSNQEYRVNQAWNEGEFKWIKAKEVEFGSPVVIGMNGRRILGVQFDNEEQAERSSQEFIDSSKSLFY